MTGGGRSRLEERLGALLSARRDQGAGAGAGVGSSGTGAGAGLGTGASASAMIGAGSSSPGRSRRARAELAGLLPGTEVETAHGPLHVHDLVRGVEDRGYARVLAKLADARARLELVAPGSAAAEFGVMQRHGLEGVLLLDLETAGLAGNPVFLAGLMTVHPDRIHLRQLLARNYLEEPALLAAVAPAVRERPLLVTYNGKAFDLPMLVDRACRHGIPFAPPAAHLDLLHHARRAYRGRTPNMKLTTLEWLICERRRYGDVPGREIPGLFHRFARDGDPTAMAAVLHHNALDLVTLAELLAHLVPHPPGQRFVPDEPELAAAFDA